jgi:type III pantothenate kinase
MELKCSVVVDVGNTQAKAAIFCNGELTQSIRFNAADTQPLLNLIESHKPTHSLLCSVAGDPQQCIDLLQQHTVYKRLSADLKWPFSSEYATLQTLGMDRVAGVAGAQFFYPQKACLVVDAGTCVTYDVINASGVHQGGAIAPGLQMRLNAMHTFTQKLPQLNFEEVKDVVGNSTRSAMLSGVFFGLVSEINGFTERYEALYGPLQVLICGGDGHLFDIHMKKGIFAAPDLVLYGLNKILDINA